MGLELLVAIHLSAVESHHVAVPGEQPGKGLGVPIVPAAQSVRVQFASGLFRSRRARCLSHSAHHATPWLTIRNNACDRPACTTSRSYTSPAFSRTRRDPRFV